METAPDEMHSHLAVTKPYPVERDTSAAQMGFRIQECGSRVLSL